LFPAPWAPEGAKDTHIISSKAYFFPTILYTAVVLTLRNHPRRPLFLPLRQFLLLLPALKRTATSTKRKAPREKAVKRAAVKKTATTRKLMKSTLLFESARSTWLVRYGSLVCV
jgi:hypothetical protein